MENQKAGFCVKHFRIGCCRKNLGYGKFPTSQMKFLKYSLFFYFLISFGTSAAQPTFADLAVVVAKGYFGGYVAPDASLAQCAAFLNSRGVVFSLFDLMDTGKTVKPEDLARSVGQVALLFSGEAELENGRIKKPLDAETWVDYCLLNDIDLAPTWDRLVQLTADKSLPEVEGFFRK